jgi:hypothetical protein
LAAPSLEIYHAEGSIAIVVGYRCSFAPLADYCRAGLNAWLVKDGILALMPTQEFSAEILNAAIDGFEAQKKRVDEQIAQVRQMLDGSGRTEPVAAPGVSKGKRRKMSAAARKRIGEAQRKRWAESKKQSKSPSSPVTAKPKRKLSAAGRKAISEAAKKRWAAVKAAQKPEPTVAKKAAVKSAVAKKPPKKTAKAPKAVKTAAQ